MVYRAKQLTICIFLFFIAVCAYAVYSAEPAGYCSLRGRYFSDEDFIRSALEHENLSGKLGDIGNFDAEKFYKESPECCHVSRYNGDSNSWFDRIFFRINTVLVVVRYEMNELSIKTFGSDKSRFYEQNLVINSCGKVLRTFGNTADKIEDFR